MGRDQTTNKWKIKQRGITNPVMSVQLSVTLVADVSWVDRLSPKCFESLNFHNAVGMKLWETFR